MSERKTGSLVKSGALVEYLLEGVNWSIKIEAPTHEIAKARVAQIADAWRIRRSLARWLYDTLFSMREGR